MIYSIFFGIQRTCEETLGTVWVIFVLLNLSPMTKRAATRAHSQIWTQRDKQTDIYTQFIRTSYQLNSQYSQSIIDNQDIRLTMRWPLSHTIFLTRRQTGRKSLWRLDSNKFH